MAPGANNGLYNGNISAMQTTLVKVNVGSANASLYTAQPQLAGYKYDQLNRINEMRTYADLAGGSVISNNNYASLSGSADAYRNTFSYDANGNIESQKRYSDNGTLLDDLTYRYELDGTGKKRSNKLYHVNDSGTSASGDINDQGTFSPTSINNLNNYSYDEIGNLVKDKAEEIDKITWTVYGKIKSIERLNTSSKPDLEFVYDAQGNRIQKIVKPKSAPGILVAPGSFINTYYTKDAQGNTLATYEKTGGSLKLKDHSIYGSSRLGVLNTDKPYSALSPVYNATNTTGTTYQIKTEGGSVNYEFSNHLGNVLTVVSDRKLPVDNNSDGTIDGFVSDVLSTSDYYAFGAQMPGRNYNAGDYRFGFNGKENDNEVKGTGNQQDYGMRIYDTRLGKFLSVDPMSDKFPELTPYQFASNSPIRCIDLDGLEALDYDMAGNAAAAIGDGFVAFANWLDEKFSTTSKAEPSQRINKVDLGLVSNETKVKVQTSITTSTNFGDKLTYLKLHNTSKGDPSGLIKSNTSIETSIENKTTVGKGPVKVFHSTSIDNNNVTTNENGVSVETTIDGVPVVSEISQSSDSKGTKVSTMKVGVGTGGANGGIIYKSSTDKTGNNTKSVGVYGEANSPNGTGMSGGTTIDVNTKAKQ